jgi:hypothetical protein
MKTTIFHNKNHGISSIRTTTGSSDNKTSTTSYMGSPKGGFTIKTGNITTRFNNRGQSMGVGIKSGDNTTYFGSSGRISSRIPAFR